MIPQESPRNGSSVDIQPTGRPAIRGVEIDLPGCSYNPEAEQHQDALAEAVAAEMAKVYAKEHLPLPNKRFNHMPEPDELTALLVRKYIFFQAAQVTFVDV